jgi:hypothetical protein
MQKMLAVASLCGAIAFLHPGEAGAQCAAKDSLQYVVAPRSGTAAVPSPAEAVRKVWKTITLGRFANTFALRNALDAAGCGIGDLAEQILARPAFAMNPAEDVDLVVVSAAELGTPTETSLVDVYARAQERGLTLAPAEVGPQLRLQYLDQPIGEFLHVGMNPINTWSGEPVIFALVNGGAGLILIGTESSANAKISATTRFLFVRPRVLAKKP